MEDRRAFAFYSFNVCLYYFHSRLQDNSGVNCSECKMTCTLTAYNNMHAYHSLHSRLALIIIINCLNFSLRFQDNLNYVNITIYHTQVYACVRLTLDISCTQAYENRKQWIGRHAVADILNT